MARRTKNQAKRNGGGSGGVPGWMLLLGGLVGGLVIAAVLIMRNGGDVKQLLPKPDPEARAPVVAEEPVAQDAPEPRSKPKYEFYDVLRDKEVVIPDAELAAQAQAESRQPETPAAEPQEGIRYLLQAGAFRSSADADALKARIALTGEVARVESAEIQGGTIYRVRLGPYPNTASLAAAKQALGSHGIEAMAIKAQ